VLPSRGAIARAEAANKRSSPMPWNGGGLGGGSLGDGANGGSDRAARLLVKH